MSRPLKITLLALVALLVLVLAIVGIVAATFDPNAYKSLAVDQVQQRYQRRLSIPGDVHLTFFPSIGARLGEVSLSERGSDKPFASLRSARVSLALLPLLSRRVVVDRVQVDGLSLRVERSKDGRLSIDDLLGAPAPAAPGAAPPAAASPPPVIDVAGIALQGATIAFDDRQAGRRVALSAADLETGRLAPGQPTELSFKGHLMVDAPAVDAGITLRTTLRLDLEPRRVALSKLQVEVDGNAVGLKALKLALRGDVTADDKAVKSAATELTIEGTQGANAIKGSLSTPWTADLLAQHLDLTRIAVDFRLPNPKGGTLPLKAEGNATLRWGDKPGLDSRLSGSLDESRFEARLGMPSFAPVAVRFDVGIDRLDLDRYRSAAPATAAPAAAASAPETPIDLSPLRSLNASGSLRIGALQAMQLKLANLKAELHAAGGTLALDPLSLDLYQGHATGSVSALASATPRFGVRQRLADVSIGPLLKDLMGKESVAGRGSVTLDVTTQGATVDALKRALAGSARAELRDGAIKGVNIAQAIREAKAKLRGEAAAAPAGAGSDFSELGASFVITKGVAHNDDLDAKSPLLRVGGSGDVDLGEGRLDYLVKATVVGTLQGQGGPELQALRGQTIPVRLKGPFTAIGYSVDLAGMAKEAAKEKVEQKVDAVKDKAKEKAKQELGDKLKGLLRK